MTKMVRQPFTPGGKFIASKKFRFHGRDYAKGDEFPWRTLSCSIRKLRQLYEGRFLNNEYVDPKELVEPITMVEETVEEVVEEELVDEPTEKPTVYDPEVLEIVNPDRGQWYLNQDGNHLLRLKAKEAKRLRKKMEPTDINLDQVFEE